MVRRVRVRRCPQGKEYIFRKPDGSEVGRASTIAEFVELLKRAPIEAITYHARERHFGPWLRMMGLRRIASKADRVSGEGENLRMALIALFE